MFKLSWNVFYYNRKDIETFNIFDHSSFCKEVINITDARRLGFVQDVCADLETGKITSIVVPGSNKILSMFTSENDIVITWDKIKCIGDDIILVEI